MTPMSIINDPKRKERKSGDATYTSMHAKLKFEKSSKSLNAKKRTISQK